MVGERPLRPVLHIAFRLRHGCKVSKLSQRFPDITMAHWCNYRVEVLALQPPGGRMPEGFADELGRILGPHELLSPEDGRSHAVLVRCTCSQKGPSIGEVIEAHGALLLYPIVYREGAEHYRVVAFEDRRVPALFRALGERGEVEVLSKRPMDGELLSQSFLVPAAEMLAGLTERQGHALLAGIEHGYYRVPRKVRTEDIAKRLRVPRTTFEEHLRKAESKVITSMGPYVALHVARRPR